MTLDFFSLPRIMNEATLKTVTDEIAPVLSGQKFGRVFQLSKLRYAIDFRLPDGKYLFISLEAAAPRIYLINRKLKDLEKESLNPNAFTMVLRKCLANAVLQSLKKDENERILRFSLLSQDEIEGLRTFALVVQLTGRSSNLFLLNDKDFIIDSLRENQGDGQTIATRYAPPVRDTETKKQNDGQIFSRGNFESLSAALDDFYQNLDATRDFQTRAKSAETKINQEIKKREKLKKNLLQDLKDHGDAEKWKKYGDLLLANLATAARIEDKVLVVDYFEDDAPTIEIDVDENLELTAAAENFFKRYTKARNAKNELEKRLVLIDAELNELSLRRIQLAQAVEEQDEEFLSSIVGEKAAKSVKNKEKRDDSFKGARKYISSDQLEILVGKASKDNDFLTFRIAKSLDFWLHAADYGGSHVVVRNPNRAAEIPQKTLYEAAQLAAFFSQAKAQPKVAVNYTQKKHVNKPKGAAPGLVSLSSFKTILVEPKESLERL